MDIKDFLRNGALPFNVSFLFTYTLLFTCTSTCYTRKVVKINCLLTIACKLLEIYLSLN